ncbi:hypothetical protein AA0113_g8728 [Alternaria arborescens]|uniref:Uncharacterized protein n=1 Tax=Alternaria arborescens TaxID=156630 RepID=A0A4V1X3D5_9PLEO|nr:hypothetical protein AA0113_g8728 [Alternaria arborescens]
MDIDGSTLREDEHFEIYVDDHTIQITDAPVYLMLGRARRLESDDSAAHPGGQPLVSSTESSILDGLDYECLILEESGKLGQFRRLGYFKFRPLRYTYSDMSDEQWLKHRIHARDLLRKQFVHDNLPGSVCGVPDQTGRYEITLI